MCRLITVSYPAIKSLSVALNPSPPSTVGIEKYHRKTVRVRRETNRFAQGEDEEREEEGDEESLMMRRMMNYSYVNEFRLQWESLLCYVVAGLVDEEAALHNAQ